MSYLDTYRLRMNQMGTSISDVFSKSTKTFINNTFQDSPFYFSVLINETPKNVQIIEDQKQDEKIMLSLPDDDISLGDLVLFDNTYWIVNNHYNNGILPKSIIQKCNHQLKYLIENEIISTPAYITNKSTFGSEIKDIKYIILPDGTLRALVQSNTNNDTITIDRRFIINNKAWKVIYVDDISYDGLIQLTLQQDTLNNNDNLALGVADYILHNYALTILNGDLLLNVDNTIQLNCELTDNGVIVSNPTLTYESNDEEICTVSSSGLVTGITVGTTTIEVSYGETNAIINIQVQEEQVADNYTLQIVGETSIKQGQSKIYTLQTFNNGVLIDNMNVNWVLSNSNCSIVDYDNNSCTVKAGNISSVSSILSVELDSNHIINTNITINIAGLW